jgi:hypothetical protein
MGRQEDEEIRGNKGACPLDRDAVQEKGGNRWDNRQRE